MREMLIVLFLKYNMNIIFIVIVCILFKETLGQWRMVFYLAAGINIGANLFYIAFASAREQPWSRSQRLSNVN